MRHWLRLALLVSLCSSPALAQQETLEVVFDLAQFSHPGAWTFSRGCINLQNPTARQNYVHETVVWLEDSNGNYVTTLHRWGRSYLYNLKVWAVKSGPGVDGVTSATPTGPPDAGTSTIFTTYMTGVHNITLPDGTYRVRIESTQCELADGYRMPPSPNPYMNGPPFGPTQTFTFTKGRTSQTGAVLGSMAPFNNVRVNYVVPAGNAPPGVYAGPDQWKRPSVTPADATATLTGTVSDPAGAPTVAWSLVSSKPNGLTATIAAPTSAITDVTFTSAGVYTFRLTATDSGGRTASDDVTVFVNATLVNSAGDSSVNSNNPNATGGIIETVGPWTWSNGPDTGNRTRAYLRYDLNDAGVTGTVTFAQLQLRLAEQTANASVFHDFFILTDPQDDWNAAGASTDFEATVTWNNQPVAMGLASNIPANQLAGTAPHQVCVHRHLFSDPNVNPGEPATVCPARLDFDLNVAAIAMHDTNRVWSFFMAPRPAGTNGMGLGSDENAVHSQLLVVTYWQTGPNQPPVAVPGSYPLVVDSTPPLGTEPVLLNGSASTDDAAIVTYEWRDNGVLLGSSASPTLMANLTLGLHTIELKVIDGGGLSNAVTTTLTVEDRFEPNHGRVTAAALTGTATGRQYDNLFASADDPGGDWYSVSLVAGSMLTAAATMTGGNLDLRLYDSAGAVVQSATTMNPTESASLTAGATGTYFVQVNAAGGVASASTYSLTLTASGGLTVTLNPSSALESAGTLAMVGTVQLDAPASAPVAVTLAVDLPMQLSLVANPVTIAMGQTSASFGLTLVDDPPGVPNQSRFVMISATSPGLNPGSAQFEILDDEAAVFVGWDKAGEPALESASSSVQLRATLTAPSTMNVVVPFTVGGTATRGSDFSTPIMATQLTIPAGATSAVYVINVVDDAEVDPDETVVVTMGAPTGATTSGATVYTLTITDDDGTTAGDGGAGGADGGEGDSMVMGSCGCTHLDAGLAVLAMLLAARRRRT